MTHNSFLSQFPATRLRRLRQNPAIRDLVQEYSVTASDLVMPYFILSGTNQRESIASMPDI